MKKKLLNLFLFMLPLAALAQKDSLYVKSIETCYGVAPAIPVSEHVSIMPVSKSDDKFELLAINDKMQVLWKTPFKGFLLTAAKFKDKIVAVSSTDYSNIKGPNNIYTGYLIDPTTGKVLLEKEILHDQNDYRDRSTFLTSPKGDFFKMAVQETGVSTSVFAGTKNEKVTKSITLFDFNEKLESTPYKPAVGDAVLAGITGNQYGDIFVCWFRANNTLQLVKYPAGKQDVKGIVGEEIDLGLSEDKDGTEYSFEMFSNLSQHDVVYLTLLRKVSHKEKQFTIVKYDFTAKHTDFTQEEFTNDALKLLNKSTIVDASNKKDKPDFGAASNIEIKFAGEKGGNIIVAFNGISLEQGSMGMWVVESSLLVNVYDTHLNLKYQAGLPSGYSGAGMGFPSGFKVDDKYFYSVANQEIGGSLITVLGKLNLATGKWDTMDWLKKDGIGKTHASIGSAALQFSNCMILPYEEPASLIKTGPRIKIDIDLYKYSYPATK